MPYTPILATLGYVFSPDGRRVLMIHRNARPDDAHLGKYNGLGVPPMRLAKGTLVAVFLSGHAKQRPFKDGLYWYLKIGSVLGAEAEDEPFVRELHRAAVDGRWVRIKLKRGLSLPLETHTILPWSVRRSREGELELDVTRWPSNERCVLPVALLLELEHIDAPKGSR